MSKCPEGLQKTLTAFENYCINWKLKVNTNKNGNIFSPCRTPISQLKNGNMHVRESHESTHSEVTCYRYALEYMAT
jgi:hypothetical protein